mmetsp:Transcript_33472/g.69131  ORF Transcript_33472/g.69131 Transcript_33472/m.69131 type:complete len:281 (+) Transcript_33472:678-1520(+)
MRLLPAEFAAPVRVVVAEDCQKIRPVVVLLGDDEVDGGGEDGDERHEERGHERCHVQPPDQRPLSNLRKLAGSDEIDGRGCEHHTDGDRGTCAREGGGHEEDGEAHECHGDDRQQNTGHEGEGLALDGDFEDDDGVRLRAAVVVEVLRDYAHLGEGKLLVVAVLREVDGRLVLVHIGLIEPLIRRADGAREHIHQAPVEGHAPHGELAGLNIVRVLAQLHLAANRRDPRSRIKHTPRGVHRHSNVPQMHLLNQLVDQIVRRPHFLDGINDCADSPQICIP